MTYQSDDFLLHTKSARALYHDFAEPMPILDYHCHLPPQKIAEDAMFSGIGELWLRGDHYKWRLMRENGISEDRITGPVDDETLFMGFAETLPMAMRNPIYDWAHLELKRYFGINELLSPKNAKAVYAACNETLKDKSFSARSLLRRMNVKVVGTTDDPIDDLSWHAKLKKEGGDLRMVPTFRPDKALAVEDPVVYNKYIDALAKSADSTISSYDDLILALDKRHQFFHDNACRCADHGFEAMNTVAADASEIRSIFSAIRSGRPLGEIESAKLKTAIFLECCRMNHKRNWAQLLHMGVLRNVRSRLFRKLGPDVGVDCIGDAQFGKPLSAFLEMLDSDNKLTRTVLFNINQGDNELLACMGGVFQDGSVPGKIQYGPAWWFLDQKTGMTRHLDTVSNFGLLSRFIGMTTDSRSFISFPRHEYFRRILCGMLGEEMDHGDLPGDMELMGGIVKDICYNNAERYFGF
ncbi:MAG: glucuronate isomerase [Chitinispirillaceae bacterium]|jgi:glucuronate isomerase|nr:glucuronate isomerase [Chitinispirillaceae bacterium]